MMITKPFEATCYSNVNRMSEEMHHCFGELIEICVPRRTRHHRQSLLPRFSSSTLELLKRLQTNERLLLEEPTLYRKRDVKNQRSIVTECAESDRRAYQQNLLEQRDTHLIFEHLKNLNKNCNLPPVFNKDGVSRRNSRKSQHVETLLAFDFHTKRVF